MGTKILMILHFYCKIALYFAGPSNHDVHAFYEVIADIFGGNDRELCPVVPLHDKHHGFTLVEDRGS